MDNSVEVSEIDDAMDISNDLVLPNCPIEDKPLVGRKFATVDEGVNFYRRYAASCGFDTRLGTWSKARDGTILSRYVLCNREGQKNVDFEDLHNIFDFKQTKRRRLSTRSSCSARVIIQKHNDHGYVVKVFNEAHNHTLVSDSYRHFMRYNRSLDHFHQSFILNSRRASIGPMRSFRLFKELVGGYDKVGCSIVEFKNFSRDLRAHVDGVDAQILLNKLTDKRELCPGFTFDYCLDAFDKLKCLFWADAAGVRNFELFGDAVSFDATYSTNRYQMIFVPFTGKDNHGRCVTFAAGLLTSEDVESYSWIFNKFKDCMGKQPNMLITDQDPTMKIAVERVFPVTRHRFCMWHIMLKVADKIPKSLSENEDFAKNFNNIVWSEIIEPFDFDYQWDAVLEEYGLADNKWFKSMFELQNYWIPAYFRDFPLSGLFRTTSLSESENSFFRRYLNKRANLIEFFMNFESAIDAQRNASAHLSSLDESCFPDMKMHLRIEKHAASVYSHKMFYEVQKQIQSAVNFCCMVNISSVSEGTFYEIDDGVKGKFSVVHHLSDGSVTCGCKRFIRLGLLCSHVFLVFKNLKIQRIPDNYIMRRWTKFVFPKYSESSNSQVGHVDSIVNQVLSDFYSCIGLIQGNGDHMNDFARDMSSLKDKYETIVGSSSLSKSKVFDNFYGSNLPDVVSVLPPNVVKTLLKKLS